MWLMSDAAETWPARSTVVGVVDLEANHVRFFVEPIKDQLHEVIGNHVVVVDEADVAAERVHEQLLPDPTQRHLAVVVVAENFYFSTSRGDLRHQDPEK